MCPCPDFNCASCLGIASPFDGDKMEVEFGDEKQQSENTHQEASLEVMQTWLTSRASMSSHIVLLFRDMVSVMAVNWLLLHAEIQFEESPANCFPLLSATSHLTQ